MIKKITVVSILTTTVWAQSSLVPQGISGSCSSFLQSLNSNADLAKCIEPLVSATSNYSPLAKKNGTGSTASMSAALTNLCSSGNSNACPDSLIRGKLGEFYAACTPELTTQRNADVVAMYDAFYVVTPLKDAVCTKDDDGKWCVTETSAAASGGSGGPANAANNIVDTNALSPSDIEKYLAETVPATHAKRAPGDDSQVTLIPNATTISRTNILFFFLSGSSSADQLCKPCTKNLLTSYIDFEASLPYAPGLSNSAFLSGQPDLYKAVQDKCGKDFLNNAVQAAGGIGTNGAFGDSSAAFVHGPKEFGFASLIASALAVIGLTLAL